MRSPAERVLAALPDAKQTAAGWQARCPAHEDRTASLSVSTGKDGRALVHCHAGCTVDAVVVALGLTLRDLMPPRAETPQIVATYGYTDEQGRHLYDVVRFAPKDFRQRPADYETRGNWKMTGVRRVPYRLHTLRRPSVFITEGEKDADALAALGVPATCNPGGAGNWTADYSTTLSKCGITRACVVLDNDEPGRKHAEDVARHCQVAGIEARVLTLPDLPPKGDVSDWLAAGGTKAALVALAKDAPIWSPTDVAAAPAAGAPLLLRLSDIAPERIDWIWHGRLARGKKTMLAADPGVGKSTLSLDIAARITRGSSWPDGGRAPLGNVLMLCAEDGLADTVRPRIDAAGGDASRVYILDGVLDEQGSTRMVSLARDLAGLEAAIEEVHPQLVIIDPITAYLGKADSYKDAEVRGLLGPVLALLPRHGAALLTIAHLSKDQQRAALHRPANSIAFIAAARIAFALAADPADDTRVILATLKSNVCAKAPSLAFRLVDTDVSEGISQARLEWDTQAVLVDAEALLRKPTPHDRADRVDAEDVLRDLLAGGPLDSKEVLAHAKDAGISERQLKDAKAALGIKPQRVGGLGATGRWIWALPHLRAKDDDANPDTCPPVLLSRLSENTPLSSPILPKKINALDIEADDERL